MHQIGRKAIESKHQGVRLTRYALINRFSAGQRRNVLAEATIKQATDPMGSVACLMVASARTFRL